MEVRDDPARNEELDAVYERFHLNRFTPPPGVGDLFMIKALAENSGAEAVDYHFGSVVATSGPDHVTMENYARHEENATLSSGDPQWYFQMYGPHEEGQSFHQQWNWEDRFAPGNNEGNRLVLTILLQR